MLPSNPLPSPVLNRLRLPFPVYSNVSKVPSPLGIINLPRLTSSHSQGYPYVCVCKNPLIEISPSNSRRSRARLLISMKITQLQTSARGDFVSLQMTTMILVLIRKQSPGRARIPPTISAVDFYCANLKASSAGGHQAVVSCAAGRPFVVLCSYSS